VKNAILALLLSASLSRSVAQTAPAEEVRLYALWLGQSKPPKAHSYETTTDRIKAQPKWDPLSQPNPLQPQDAAQIATKWMRSQPNGDAAFSVLSYKLQRCPSPFQEHWFYMIDFAFEQHRQTPTRVAIILLDGTVVEPKLREFPQ
jgi:hypothetical protein